MNSTLQERETMMDEAIREYCVKHDLDPNDIYLPEHEDAINIIYKRMYDELVHF